MFQMSSEPMDTGSPILFGATDIRIRMDKVPWAARKRQELGLTPLPGDEELILMDDIDLLAGQGRLSQDAAAAAPTQAPAVQSPVAPPVDQSGSQENLMDLLEPLQPDMAPTKEGSTSGSAPAPRRKKKFLCTVCPRVFGDKRKLRCHWESDHEVSYKGFRCPEEGCGAPFHPRNQNLLRTHLRGTHKWSGDAVRSLVIRKLPLVSIVNRSAPQGPRPACLRRKPAARSSRDPMPRPSGIRAQPDSNARGPQRDSSGLPAGSHPSEAVRSTVDAIQRVATTWADLYRETQRQHAEERRQWQEAQSALQAQIEQLKSELQGLRK